MTTLSTEQKSSKGTNHNESTKKVYHLFIQLKLLLINPENINETSSPATILNNLTNISIEILDRKSYTPADAVNIFEIMLNNYILLLDTDEFLNIIIHRYSLANNNFLSNFCQFTETDDCATSDDQEKMYYRLLNQMNSSTRLISFLKTKDNRNSLVNNSCSMILITILRVLCDIDSNKADLSMIGLKKYENTLFNSFMIFIDEHISSNKPSDYIILTKYILDYLQGMSRDTTTTSILININCPQILLKLLSSSYFTTDEYELIIDILFGITYHDEGLNILNKYQCDRIIDEFKNNIFNVKSAFIIDKELYDRLVLRINMLIISTGSRKNIYNKFNIIRENLVVFIQTVCNSFTFECEGIHVLDALKILMKLFNDDDIVNYVLKTGDILRFLVDILDGMIILMDGNDLDTWNHDKMNVSIIVLVNILWSISFQEQYKEELIKNIHLLETLKTKDLLYHLLSRHIFSLKRSIDGIYQNLYPSNIRKKNKTHQTLFISCSYVDMNYAKKLYNELIKNFKVSIGIDSDEWKKIAQNIQQSEIILFLISKDFSDNKSCRQEFIYVTDILKKPFIRIYIESDYQPIDWISIRINSIKSIRFEKEGENFVNTCQQLVSVIQDTSSVQSSMNDTEVKQWFNKNNLMLELYEFYQFQNMNELSLYAKAILAYPWTKEYERIKVRFEEKNAELKKELSPFDFLQFINALKYFNLPHLD